MFTGIVQTKARVKSLAKKEQFLHLILSVEENYLKGVEIGASIAINGVCLTVTDYQLAPEPSVSFDVIDETLLRTNLGLLSENDRVNFERSLTFGKEIGGHLVSGHVHTTATIVSVVKTPQNCQIELGVNDSQWCKYILEKGFISIDGASLTIGKVAGDRFFLHLIPETLAITRLGDIVSGDKVNVEIDSQTQTIVDTVERVLAARVE